MANQDLKLKSIVKNKEAEARDRGYNIPPGGHQDTGQVEKDEKGMFIVNLDEVRKGDSSDTLRIPGNTVNPPYMGGGPIEPGQYLDEDTYEALTGLDQIREDRFLTKKGKRFHKKYNKQNK